MNAMNNTTQPAHTPLPWTFTPSKRIRDKIRGITTHLAAEITDSENENLICSAPNCYHAANYEANAQFIVRACNSHYELVAALKFALDFLESPAMTERQVSWDVVRDSAALRATEIRTALSKATS